MGSGRDIALRTFRRFHPDRLAALIALVMLGGDWRRWGVGVTKVDDVPIHCAFNFLREWDAGRAWCAALQHARTWKQTMSAQALVEKAPWPYIFKDDLVEGSGLTPLCLAVDMGLSPTYLQPFLTNGATIDAPSRDKSTPLTIGARKGFTATVSFLLAAGANPNTATLTRATPLILASRYGHADAVALLLAAGADTTRAESGGMTAILWASRAGHLVAVTHLITWGTSVHTATREGDTPLLFASMRGHALVVAALLAAGADPNTRSNAGTTSLILACHGPHADCARLLLDAGADPCTADNAGTTPVIVACQSGSTAILSMLVAAGVHLSGAQGGAALFMAAMNAQVDTVRALLEIGVDVASRVLVPGRSRAGAERPLFGAVYGGSPEIVQALVDAGADVRGPSGEEALRTARYFCRRDVEKVLRLAGAGGELDGEWSE
ncbi:ankyrin [Gonapodya prolifera JEL478]|uniref:Ankyrin n=1 Tax=Gonapodya prolifera (strain JEL478) TaxID=1344416 RepID=A0A139ATS3_GONPJ|nr:ankyrin [Gonapodya prolifera JEL478]|eukprot:KXS20130.1 ankyrin [Gonapodya prolifera JEL478]